MTKERVILLVVCVLMSLTVLSLMFGCSIFQKRPTSLPPVPTSSGQLWNAVKGSNWLVTFSIIGIAGGFFAFINGSKMGFPAMAACGISLFMALAVARFALWMAIFGMIGVVAAIAISILVKNKALKEMVFGIQQVKEEVIQDVHKPRTKEILSKQTKPTQKLIAQIKIKEKLKSTGKLYKSLGWGK